MPIRMIETPCDGWLKRAATGTAQRLLTRPCKGVPMNSCPGAVACTP